MTIPAMIICLALLPGQMETFFPDFPESAETRIPHLTDGGYLRIYFDPLDPVAGFAVREITRKLGTRGIRPDVDSLPRTGEAAMVARLDRAMVLGRISRLASIFPILAEEHLPPETFFYWKIKEHVVCLAAADARGLIHGSMLLTDRILLEHDSPSGREEAMIPRDIPSAPYLQPSLEGPYIDPEGYRSGPLPFPYRIFSVEPEAVELMELNNSEYWEALLTIVSLSGFNRLLLPYPLVKKSFSTMNFLLEERAVSLCVALSDPGELADLAAATIPRERLPLKEISISPANATAALEWLPVVTAFLKKEPDIGLLLKVGPEGPDANVVSRYTDELGARMTLVCSSLECLSEPIVSAGGSPPPPKLAVTIPGFVNHLLRFGAEEMVTDFLDRARLAGAKGFVLPAGPELLKRDETLTDWGNANTRDWTYRFEKEWFGLWLWGWLGMGFGEDSLAVMDHFSAAFDARLGPRIYRSFLDASRILSEITDWLSSGRRGALPFVEGAHLGISTEDAGPGDQPGMAWLTPERILHLSFSNGSYVDPAEFVGMLLSGYPVGLDQRTNPEELALRLEQLARGCRSFRRERVRTEGTPFDIRFYRSFDLEIGIAESLGILYASLIRTAIGQGLFQMTGDPSHFRDSLSEREKGEQIYTNLGRLARHLFVPIPISEGGSFQWEGGPFQVDTGLTETMSPGVRKELRYLLTPFPLEGPHLGDIESRFSDTDYLEMDHGYRTAQGIIQWTETTVLVPDEILSSEWMDRAGKYSGYVNGRVVFPYDQGVLYGKVDYAAAGESPIRFTCPTGNLEKAWWNGAMVYLRSATSENQLADGMILWSGEGSNRLFLRSDLSGEELLPWGFAPRLERLDRFSITATFSAPDRLHVEIENLYPERVIQNTQVRVTGLPSGVEMEPMEQNLSIGDRGEAVFSLRPLGENREGNLKVSFEAIAGDESHRLDLIIPDPE